MKITRDVILDLLPLYLADEVSADTRALVAEFLEGDPELAQIARSSALEMKEDIPVPLTKEDKMEAYEEAKLHLLRRIVILAALFAFSCLAFMGVVWLAAFFLMSR
jgi:hypothetical protein